MSNKVKVIVYYGKAPYDLSLTCCFCDWFINQGDYYVKNFNEKAAHYLCSKAGGWKRKPKRKNLTRAVEKSVENIVRPIRIIKKKA